MTDTKTDDAGRPDVNVRSLRYGIAHTEGTCWYCRSSTRLVALAVPPGHHVLEPGGGTEGDAEDKEKSAAGEDGGIDGGEHSSADEWSVAAQWALLFHVEYLPAAAGRRLSGLAPSYRRQGNDTAGACWANHCDACNALLDDHELFCEPDAAFLPMSDSGAERVRLLIIDEPLEAAAAGYSHELQFLDAMS